MNREEAWNRIDAIIARHEIDDDYVTITSLLDYDALRLARKLLEQDPCEDAISRQAVLNYIRDNYRRWFINDDAFIQCVNGIKDIVPVTSQQKMGRWKPYDGSWYECSECGAVREAVGFFENYCPNCGRKMEVDDE